MPEVAAAADGATAAITMTTVTTNMGPAAAVGAAAVAVGGAPLHRTGKLLAVASSVVGEVEIDPMAAVVAVALAVAVAVVEVGGGLTATVDHQAIVRTSTSAVRISAEVVVALKGITRTEMHTHREIYTETETDR